MSALMPVDQGERFNRLVERFKGADELPDCDEAMERVLEALRKLAAPAEVLEAIAQDVEVLWVMAVSNLGD